MNAAENGAIEPEIVPVEETGALESITRGEVDIQVATARRYPRSIKRFQQEALSLATLDEDTAQSCRYLLPRAGKDLTGPSIRLAEIVASCWGHLRCESRIVDEGPEFITAQATAWDMERNVLIRIENRRRITDSHGRRYNEDMRTVTGNAAGSIAFRNAVLRVVPTAFIRPVYRAVCKVILGDIKTLTSRRTKALDWFAARGATTAKVLEFLGREGIEDVNLEDVSALNGIRTAVIEGQVSIDNAFARKETENTETAAERRSAKPEELKAKEPAKEESKAGEKPDPKRGEGDSDKDSAPDGKLFEEEPDGIEYD